MMKTTLTVDIEYDPAWTDPEGLACAMDRLMETALSTPGILDDYQNPKVGEFLVAGAALNAGSVDRPVSPMLCYELQIDGPLLRAQRRLLLKLLDAVSRHEAYIPKTLNERGLWEGLVALTDAIAAIRPMIGMVWTVCWKTLTAEGATACFFTWTN